MSNHKKTIYKSLEAKKAIMTLYDEKLANLGINFTEIDITTSYGRTRVINAGNKQGKKIVLFHGFSAGAPLTLEVVKELAITYNFYAIDTIGQATKSAETILDIKDNSFGKWADEVIEGLNIVKANYIGISYGAFILQKLIMFNASRIEKCVFCVPSGIVNGNIWESITKLTIPLIKFKINKSDKNLKNFIYAFAPENEESTFKLLKNMMHGIKLDTRIPKLLKPKDVSHFNNPVYIITASKDIYFPSEKIINRSKHLFKNLKEIYVLKGSKHMPSRKYYSELQQKIKEWI